MSRYVLDHHLEGEKKRLALMSQLLDPMHRRVPRSMRRPELVDPDDRIYCRSRACCGQLIGHEKEIASASN